MIRAAVLHIRQICTPLHSSRCDSLEGRRQAPWWSCSRSSFDHSSSFCELACFPQEYNLLSPLDVYETCVNQKGVCKPALTHPLFFSLCHYTEHALSNYLSFESQQQQERIQKVQLLVLEVLFNTVNSCWNDFFEDISNVRISFNNIYISTELDKFILC